MAGHSQFKNIMHRKGAQEEVRSKLFGKLAREITVAAKMGLPDPKFNPRLRAAIIAANAENMPKDNIDRAIKKAIGDDAESYDEMRYEGYGPAGVAVIVEVLTDNSNRTAGEVRAAFTKAGGNLAETGAVSFMFDHVGVVEFGTPRWRTPTRCWRPQSRRARASPGKSGLPEVQRRRLVHPLHLLGSAVECLHLDIEGLRRARRHQPADLEAHLGDDLAAVHQHPAAVDLLQPVHCLAPSPRRTSRPTRRCGCHGPPSRQSAVSGSAGPQPVQNIFATAPSPR